MFYERTILSDELTKINAAVIGNTTIIVARKILLKKALNEGVIVIEIDYQVSRDNYSIIRIVNSNAIF